MAMTVQQMRPVAHLPLVLGVLRRLAVATIIDRLIPPYPAHEQNPQSARRNNVPGEQISRRFLLLSGNLSASNYPGPAHVLSCGRGVEALVLAILDGDHALYKVGKRLEERGIVSLLQPGLTRASLHDGTGSV